MIMYNVEEEENVFLLQKVFYIQDQLVNTVPVKFSMSHAHTYFHHILCIVGDRFKYNLDIMGPDIVKR